jgi:predicted DNA-binding transcriptional regulator AlpA
MPNRTNYFKRPFWDHDRVLPERTGGHTVRVDARVAAPIPPQTSVPSPAAPTPGTSRAGEASTSARPSEQPRLLTTKQAAVYLGSMSPRSLERWRLLGEGPRYLKIGAGKRAAVRYLSSDLDAWLEAHAYNSTAEYPAERRQVPLSDRIGNGNDR